jgi:hypothetical protein
MSSFNEREKGFENKFKHDQEMAFKAAARRNKLLGMWAAREMGLTGAAAEDYAKTLVRTDLDKLGDLDVLKRVQKDLAAKGKNLTEHRIRAEMDALLAIARKQITEN